MADYNGYPNRATWNVSLWLNNEEPLYRELQRMTQRADSLDNLETTIKTYCYETWRNGMTPDDDLLSECDFRFIARNKWEEREADNA